jgi:cytochrome c oxidase cbb3-type subunit 4
MDINDLRSIHTVLSFLCFVIIAVWAYSGRVKRRFEEAANLPFTEDDEPIVSEGARSRGTQS